MPNVTVFMLLGAWGVVTAVLIVVLIYRSMLETHDEEQLFLDPAERALANEQRSVVARIQNLRAPIMTLGALSAVLFLTTAGFWLYQGLKGF